MGAAKYLNKAQQRALRTLEVLISCGEAGALPGEVALRIGTIPSNSTRDLANLLQAGFARQVDGRWYSRSPMARGGSKPGR